MANGREGGLVQGAGTGDDQVPGILTEGCSYEVPGEQGPSLDTPDAEADTVEEPAAPRLVPVVIDGVFHGMREET